MARRRRPLAGPLPFGRENKLCASAAAASLASLLRRSLTQTPEEPNDAWLALTIIAVVIGCTVSSFHSHTDLANVSSFWATLVKIYCHQKAETDPSYVLSDAVP